VIANRAEPHPPDRSILGDAATSTLLPVQSFHSAGESLFALSLVGSLFFNVSVDAARPRILLYLALTMAPFAVLAPLIGPLIDKLRNGHRVVLLFSLGGRAVVALLLATQLKTLLLYPEAFIIVVLAKTFAVARNALVPSLVDDRDHLVVVNSRLARVGAVSGVVAALVGVGILQIGDAAWLLRGAAVVYGLGALSALRIPDPHLDAPTSPIVESTEMHGPGVQLATTAMAALRMATGLLIFHVGFALKISGEPTWLIALVAGSGALGGFAGTFVAPWLRARIDEQWMLTTSLLVPALVAGLAALRFHGVTAMAVTASLGLAGSVGRRAFDGVVQTEAPHARRGQAYAGLETRLEIAWVVGALVAVLTRAPDWLGLVMMAAGLGALAIDRIGTRLAANRVGAVVEISTLPLRLMETAETVAARGDRQQAVLVAVAAVEAAAISGLVSPDELANIQVLGRRAAHDNDPASEDNIVQLAHQLVTEADVP
jgi:MFS family permease